MDFNTSLKDYPIITVKKALGWSFAEIPVYKGYEFEKINMDSWGEYMAQNKYYAYYTGAIYIATIFGIQRYMRDRKALDLRLPLFFWNLSLGIFSIAAFIRTFPGLMSVVIQPNGLYKSICINLVLQGRNGHPNILLVYASKSILFAASKYVELGDTVFIVLRKRPLIFLQWYHHLVTLLAVWLSGPLAEPIIRYYAVMNTGVHSLMYPYFALRAIGLSTPAPLVNLITTLQFTQMLVGFCVNTSSWYFHASGLDCIRYPGSIKGFAALYGSFIFLFGRLFYYSVIKSGRKSRSKRD